MQTRFIPVDGRRLPVVGCGTWNNFDVGSGSKERARLAGVLSTLAARGGSVVDSSPMYGRAEEVVGGLLSSEKNVEHNYFVATKVWTQGRDAGIAQMESSMELLGRKKIDLMQIHNLVDWRSHLATLRTWKAKGRIAYLGITHYTDSAYPEMESIMKKEALDFIQLNYSIEEVAAEKRLLPLAVDRGIAVLVNLPFGAGRLLRGVKNRPVPTWAREHGCESWAQVLLKFVLSHPAVTCVIPGTGQPQHMLENCAAGAEPFFDEKARRALRKLWEEELS